MSNYLKKLRDDYIRFIKAFFDFFGRQNDYLYPNEQTKDLWHPFQKKHLWKTRFGFITSFEIAKFCM